MNSVSEAQKAIEALDLGPIKFKLTHPDDGLGWSPERANRAEILYRRFLLLVAENPNSAIVPSEDVDEFWHVHILDTIKYAQDSIEIFGYFLHHFPYFGLRGDADRAQMNRAFEETVELYEQRFGRSEPRYAESLDGAVCGGCGCHKVPGLPGFAPRTPMAAGYLTRPTISTN